jgi:hypothetical protein
MERIRQEGEGEGGSRRGRRGACPLTFYVAASLPSLISNRLLISSIPSLLFASRLFSPRHACSCICWWWGADICGDWGRCSPTPDACGRTGGCAYVGRRYSRMVQAISVRTSLTDESVDMLQEILDDDEGLAKQASE